MSFRVYHYGIFWLYLISNILGSRNIYFWNTTGLLAEFLPACIMISRDKGTLFTDYKAFMSSLLKVEDHRFALAQSARSDLSGRRRSARRGKQPRRHYHGLTEEQAVMIKEEYNEVCGLRFVLKGRRS